MRTHAFVLTALTVLLALPSESSAQRRPPRTGRGRPGAQPAPLPPEAPAVSRALAYRRSRWSVEGYPFVTQIQVPAATGGPATYTTVGTGSHGDYRFTDFVSGTFDVTTTLPFTTTMSGSAEVGTRFRPMPWGEHIRPFFDLRAAYAYLSDMYAAPSEIVSSGSTGPTFASVDAGRRSRGMGGVVGVGLEYSLTRTIALTTEVTGTRSHMTAYRLTPVASPTSGNDYWMTSARYTLGLKFNPVRALHLQQNPRQ